MLQIGARGAGPLAGVAFLPGRFLGAWGLPGIPSSPRRERSERVAPDRARHQPTLARQSPAVPRIQVRPVWREPQRGLSAFCVHRGHTVPSQSSFLCRCFFFFSFFSLRRGGEEREPAFLEGIPGAGILKHSRTKVFSQLCGNGTLS